MIGKDVKQIRKRVRLGQEKFWNRIGLSQSGGCRYENNVRRIPTNVELLIALAYGTNEEAVSLLMVLRGADFNARQVLAALKQVSKEHRRKAKKKIEKRSRMAGRVPNRR